MMTRREELRAARDARAATLADLRALLAERQRERRAVRGAFDGDTLATMDPETVIQQAARELALDRIIDALIVKIGEAEELSTQARRQYNALVIDAQARAGYIDRLVRDLGPGGYVEKQERDAQRQMDSSQAARADMARQLSEAQAELARRWGDAPIPHDLPRVVDVAQDLGDW